MAFVLLVIHMFLALALGTVVLLQHSTTGDLGSIGGGGNSGALAPRASSNPLVRATTILAGLFMLTSLSLAWISSHHSSGHSLLDKLQSQAISPLKAGAATTPDMNSSATKAIVVEKPSATPSKAPASTPSVPVTP